MRIIVFSGKGGSGTSTIAAGTACLLAESGLRTLAFALNSGLGAALDAELGLDPLEVMERLDGVEGRAGLSSGDEFRDWLHSLLDFRNMETELADDLATLPGVNHIGRLLELEHLLASEEYDAATLDAASLAQFLDLPAALDAAARWLDRLFSTRQQSVFEPFVRAFAGDYAERGEEVFDNGREMLGRLANLRDLLTDPEVTSVRLVATPNKSAVDEMSEALGVLSLFSYRVDAVVAGCVLPETIEDPFFDGQKKEQVKVTDSLRKMASSPLLRAELQSTVPRGTKAVSALARAVYGELDPAGFLSPGEEHSVTRESSHYLLQVFVPHARKEDLRLEEVDDGIAVHLNGRRCVLTLPDDVRYRSATKWSYEDDVLTVTLTR